MLNEMQFVSHAWGRFSTWQEELPDSCPQHSPSVPKGLSRGSCREGWLSQQYHLSRDFWILHVLNIANRNRSLMYTDTSVIFCFLIP